MKTFKQVILFLIIIVAVYLFSFDKVLASDHKLEDLHIDVVIKHDGSAEITEKRTAHLTEGTENYIVIENLGKSEIIDFVVREDGKKYSYLDSWDIDASQADKAFKNGMTETKDGYELSWGIGDYGDHEYVLEYTITNFVKQLNDDNQMLFWQFVNDQTNIPPEKVVVEIETEEELNEETEKIWAFGFSGEVEFLDGKVIATSDSPLTQSDYVTILVHFPEGMFSTDDQLNKSFEDVKEEAFKDSDYETDASKEDNHASTFSKTNIINKLIEEGKEAIAIFVIIVVAFIIYKLFQPSLKLTKKKPEKYRRQYKGEYYRDFPYKGEFVDGYYIFYMMGVSNFENLLSSFLLKWINEGRIETETENMPFFKNKEIAAIHFLDKEMEKTSLEGELFHIMLKAADFKDVLNENVLAAWGRKNKKAFIHWEKKAINKSWEVLEDAGYVKVETKNGFFRKKEKYAFTEKGQRLETRVHQYMNYIHNFSLLNEQEAINVKIWDEIMIWAAVFGLTEVAKAQFEKLYPSYDTESIYYGNTLSLTKSFTNKTSKSRTESRFSGLGGSSSSGGGGGSFGGGSGGGTR